MHWGRHCRGCVYDFGRRNRRKRETMRLLATAHVSAHIRKQPFSASAWSPNARVNTEGTVNQCHWPAHRLPYLMSSRQLISCAAIAASGKRSFVRWHERQALLGRQRTMLLVCCCASDSQLEVSENRANSEVTVIAAFVGT